MGGWALNAYDLGSKARYEHREQLEAANSALLSDNPFEVMPPDGIDPLRWRSMLKSLQNAIKDGNEDQIQ